MGTQRATQQEAPRRAGGQAANGTVDVAEDHARLEVMLPWPLAQIADKIQRAIQSQGKTMLEKK
jgi:Putative polyhydroxyalkanoic acid system protein (PHA_gran_rgn)